MHEFRLPKAKDIVDVDNTDKQFKIFDSDDNLIIEGKGSDIYDFLRSASIKVEFEKISYRVTVDYGSFIRDCPAHQIAGEEEDILYYQISLPFKFSRVGGNTVYVKRETYENPLKDKITFVDTHPNQTKRYNVLLLIFSILCITSFAVGNILLYFKVCNPGIPYLLLTICVICIPIMLLMGWRAVKIEK